MPWFVNRGKVFSPKSEIMTKNLQSIYCRSTVIVIKWFANHAKYHHFFNDICAVVQFTEPATGSYRLPHATFGECATLYDKNNIICSSDNTKCVNSLIFVRLLLPQRESGLQVFQLFINKLDAGAKHKFFRWEYDRRRKKTPNHGCISINIRKKMQSFLFC